MNIVQKALNLAIKAHEGQVDKGGLPYINHPVYLALQMNTDEEKAVALLHDVLEDSEYLYEDIISEVGEEIAICIKYLTRKNHEDYFKYIDRIKNSNKIVIKIKIADLKHNSDISRIELPTDKDFKRIEKYQKAIQILDSM